MLRLVIKIAIIFTIFSSRSINDSNAHVKFTQLYISIRKFSLTKWITNVKFDLQKIFSKKPTYTRDETKGKGSWRVSE